jgi:hypothetical protein
LFIPGTTRLPSPFPAIGKLEVIDDQLPLPGGEKLGARLVVSRRIAPHLTVRWTVLVDNVSAILVTGGNEPDFDKDTWLFSPSVRTLSLAAKKEENWKGIVFVPEGAPVLMSVDVGATASESEDHLSALMRHCDDPCH